ncbi:hypothetical protein PC122_g23053 [Phytophthora cactorum]|nr:hypothetical protein PC122_g23053 [Phytophthora cactorum]
MRTDLAILVRYKTPASDSLKFEINLYLARVSTIKTKGKCTIRATADEVEMLQYSVFTSSGRLANMFTYPFRSKRQVSRIVNLGVKAFGPNKLAELPSIGDRI